MYIIYFIYVSNKVIMKYLFWVDLVEFWKKLEIVLDVKKINRIT